MMSCYMILFGQVLITLLLDERLVMVYKFTWQDFGCASLVFTKTPFVDTMHARSLAQTDRAWAGCLWPMFEVTTDFFLTRRGE